MSENPEQDRMLSLERQLLAQPIVWPEDAAAIAEMLEPGDYFADRHRRVALAVKRMVADGRHVDHFGLVRELEADGLALIDAGRTLHELLDDRRCEPLIVLRGYAQELREHALKRRMATEWQAGAVDAAQGFTDTTAPRLATIAEIQRQIDGLGRDDESEAARIGAMLDRLQHPEQRVALSTGLGRLDERLDGGLGEGWLVVVLGAPKMGKTVLATNNLGRAAMRSGRPLLYCGEMSEPELMGRWLAAESGVPLRAQRRGDLTAWQWSSVQSAAETMGRWCWRCEPVAGVAKIAAAARAYAGKVGRLGMVCVDYLQLVSNGNDNRTLDLEETTRGLKLLSGELQCPIVLVSQPTNDAAKNKTELGLFDGKGSGSIASDCDLCLVPVREESSERAGLLAVGYRHGESFRLELGSLRFNGARMTFEES